MSKKVYAIKEGYDSEQNVKVENIIVRTWSECLNYVKGVKGAKYKSFQNIKDANEYLADDNKLLKKGIDSYPENCLHLYVDGSYNTVSEMYSYGIVAVRNNIIEYIEGKSSVDTSKSNLRQIAGELEGAIKALEYAYNNGEEEVVLFHDYEGIYHHAVGTWERKDKSSQYYYSVMNSLFNKGIKVIFVKVDSHTGDLYNELADEMCKSALKIDSDKTIERWLCNNNLYVANTNIKDKLLKVVKNRDDKIIIKKQTNNNGVNTLEEITKILRKLPEDKKLDVLKYIKYIEKK